MGSSSDKALGVFAIMNELASVALTSRRYAGARGFQVDNATYSLADAVLTGDFATLSGRWPAYRDGLVQKIRRKSAFRSW